MMRPLRIAVVLLALAGVGLGAYLYWGRGAGRSADDRLILYGHIDIRDAQLAFKEQERIVEVLVEEGERVTAGQVLARLDTRRLKAQTQEAQAQAAAGRDILNRLLAGTRRQEIEQARAERDAAQVRLTNAQRTYERVRETAGAGVSSQQALDNARAQLDVDAAQLKIREKALQLAIEGPRAEDIAEARSRLEATQAALELLKIRLADCELRAPAAGVVRNRILEPGEMADPSRPVMSISLTDPKWVRAYAPEPYLGHVRPGDKAHVSSDSFPGQQFDGWIGFISPEAEFTPKNVETTDLRTKLVYEIRVFVHDPEDRLRLGMPVSVEIVPGNGGQK